MTCRPMGAAIDAAGGVGADVVAALDEDDDRDLRVLRGRERGVGDVRRVGLGVPRVDAVLGGAGLGRDGDAVDRGPAGVAAA